MANAIGICTGGSWLNEPSDDALKRDIDNIAAIGLRWIRWDWQWPSVEWEQGTFGKGLERRVMLADYIRRAGLNSLPVLGYTPKFYRQPGLEDTANAPPASQFYGQWGRYIEKCLEGGASAGVIRYGHWNESNHEPFWRYPSVHVQAAMMRKSLEAAQKVQPEARFVLGEFAPGKTRPDPGKPGRYLGINMVDYVDQWYSAGFKYLAQGPWSTHPYSTEHPEETQPWSVMTTQFEAMRVILKRHGHGMKKIWGTEFGYTTEPNDPGGRPEHSEARQAELLVKQVSLWQNKSGAGPGFVFCFRDFPHGGGLNGLGICRQDGSFKPARAALRELLT